MLCRCLLFLLQISTIFLFSTTKLQNKDSDWSFVEKAPYRIWTDDLRLTMALLYRWVKGALLNQFLSETLATMNLLHVPMYIIYGEIYMYMFPYNAWLNEWKLNWKMKFNLFFFFCRTNHSLKGSYTSLILYNYREWFVNPEWKIK